MLRLSPRFRLPDWLVSTCASAACSSGRKADVETLQASRLKVTLTKDLKILPPSDDLVFGKVSTFPFTSDRTARGASLDRQSQRPREVEGPIPHRILYLNRGWRRVCVKRSPRRGVRLGGLGMATLDLSTCASCNVFFGTFCRPLLFAAHDRPYGDNGIPPFERLV